MKAHAHLNLEHYTKRETERQRGVRRVRSSQTSGSRGVGARSGHRWFVDGGSTRTAMVGEKRRRSGDGDVVQWCGGGGASRHWLRPSVRSE